MSHAKKLIVPVLCVLLGCAGGALMGPVTAQTWPEPASAPRWQQECQIIDEGRPNEWTRQANQLMRERGAAGWEFAGAAGPYTTNLCFKRPAP